MFSKTVAENFLEPNSKQKFYELEIRRYGDERGFLTTIEENEIPFKIKRVYYISGMEQNQNRAKHAHKVSQRILTAINGKCNITLFDGKEKKVFELNSPQKAVYFDKGIWCELSDFSKDSIVLALADTEYFEEDYIRNFDEYLSFIKKD